MKQIGCDPARFLWTHAHISHVAPLKLNISKDLVIGTPPPLHYLTSCDYEAPDKGLCLFTPSKVPKRPPHPHFTVSMIGLLWRWAGGALHLVFLKVEATDLNKCLSIMNTALKLQKLAGSCLIKLRVLLSEGGWEGWGGQSGWTDDW